MHWNEHVARLLLGATALGWDVSWLGTEEPEILAWLSCKGTAAGRMQLFPDAVSIRFEALPDPISSSRLIAMEHPLGDIRGDSRAAHKGLLGAWDIMALNQVAETQADDALLFWPDLTIAETTISAIGLQRNGRLFIPPRDGRVSSIAEASELPLWALSRGLAVERRPIRLDEVSSGQLWCMNAVRGLWQAEIVQT